MSTKKELRKIVFARRKEATDAEIEEKSRRLFARVTEMPAYAEAKRVFCYADYNHEVMTGAFMEQCWKDGKEVAVPRVNGDVMNFYSITSADQLSPGCKGIPEPLDNPEKGYDSEKHLADDWEDAFFIIPGVAFDAQRHRCGYGGGFYDKYKEQHRNHTTVAVAFDFQVLEEVPADEYDIKPMYLVTESRVYS